MSKRSFILAIFGGLFLALSLWVSLVYAQDTAPPADEPGVTEGVSAQAALAPEAAEAVAGRPFSGGPAYDSGWVAIDPDQAITLEHNLGFDPNLYVVDMQYRSPGANGVNQRYYGGADFGANIDIGSPGDRVGAYWRSLTDTSISIYRRPEDPYAPEIRIRIWVDAFPNYDSGWVAINTDQAIILDHNLMGNPDDYVVDMQFRSGGSGVNQRYYGGADFGANIDIGSPGDRVGAYWRTLTDSQITIFRRAEDTYASEIRIRIWVRPQATYDSGWVAITINTDQAIILDHGLGGSTNDYLVDMQFRSGGSGVNQRYFGGADFGANIDIGSPGDRVGAYWRTLTDSQITIFRRAEDTYASEIRIRIFRAWTPTPPDYDSGWVDLATDAAAVLEHNLGGSTETYLVDMQYRAQDVNGINQRYFGGSDYGDTITVGAPNDRVGAYWRSLTDTSITVYRRPEDMFAPQVRIRIWVMPQPDYDSGWVAKAPGEAASELVHNLGGSYQEDYLVDFQYRSLGSGVNQRYYGGADFGANIEIGSPDDRMGAYWRSLDGDSITIYRRPDDVYAEQLRVRIWRIGTPDYDSGWFTLGVDESAVKAHALGAAPEDYFLTMYQWDTDVANTMNQRHYGGADFGSQPPAGYAENDRVGAYWRTLTDQEITAYRRPDDGFSDFLRVRIWDITEEAEPLGDIFLPFVIR